MRVRAIVLQVTRFFGAVVGYGCLVAFLYLLGSQLYRWFREGEWTHVGTSDGIRFLLVRCCAKGGPTGKVDALMHWLDAPVDWLGLHKILEVIPASLALLAVSIFANCIFIYSRDRIDEYRRSR
jgi:hypothetical protein